MDLDPIEGIPSLYIKLWGFILLAIAYLWIDMKYGVVLWRCPIKTLFHVPCPGCGITRSLMALWNGCFYDSVWINPLGLLLVVLFAFGAVMSIRDLICRDWLFLRGYDAVSAFLYRHKSVALPMTIIMIVLNWLWSISKGI